MGHKQSFEFSPSSVQVGTKVQRGETQHSVEFLLPRKSTYSTKKLLILKAPIKIAADNTLIFVLLFFEENKA